ncbi:NrdR family transcriptional regulator protein [Rhizobium phaseoli]|uniref:NrdR family transcriptional regulator n=1 Tax=Rhizobium phaseoli TaxID=396 RepID=UPI0007F0E0D5|nr:NrdR family transcriptional regulator protein [Rhizobium phaseoli]
MICNECGLETSVTDSRSSSSGNYVRRRRECDSCKARFTTYEMRIPDGYTPDDIGRLTYISESDMDVLGRIGNPRRLMSVAVQRFVREWVEISKLINQPTS